MNNKTLILIGLCICLLFTLPMVSAADASADSDIIDNSVIGSDIDSQAIAAIDENGLDDKGIDYSLNSSAEEDSGMDSIGIVDDDNSDMDDNDAEISSGKDRNVLSASPLGADGEGNTFSDLKILIENAIASGQPLTLGRDFVFTSGEDDALINGIVIASPITINGGFHTIDGNGMARIFVINSDNVFLRDITFKGGKTTNGDHGSNGGALFIQGNHATVVNCNFTNNTVLEKGGAIYIAGDDCTLNNTVFRDNIAHDDGGAIAWYGDNGKVNDLTASGNTADGENGNPNGGTMLVTGDNMAMDKLNISNSRLYKDGGEKSLKGGAIFLTGNNCNITNSAFTNCSVESSVENSSGGAIYVLGNNTNIIGCNFTNNSAIEDGGAIFIEGDDCTLNHTILIGNVAHNDGGAIEWNGDNGRIYDLTASGNYADCGNGGSKGGTLLISGNNMALDKLNVSNTYVNGLNYAGSSAVQGGALALSGNDCNITNSTFTNCSVIYYKDNSNASGGALYIWGNNTNIVNCNFTNNTASEDGGAIYIDGKGCTLNNTVFIGNVAHNDGGAIEWNGDNGRVYNLTAIGNYADSEEGYYYGNASEGSSKGGTLVLSGNNMALEKLNITNSRVFATHYTGDKPLQGGAVFLTGNNCNISDSIFHNCSVKYDKEKSNGGAMYIVGNNARLINCNFTKNTATQGAGAIYIEGNAAFMENCNVLNNSAKDAGGIWISGKENIINNTDISNNRASRNGGGVYYQGNNNTVSYCNIDNNSAVLGGNVYMASGMVGSKLLGSNITNGNASSFGGGVEWLSNSRDCLIKDCYFYKDFSYGHGGAIHWNPGTNGQIDNCTFENCSVNGTKNGGAVYAGSTNAVASGTIISNSTFINCTSGTRGVLNWIGNNGLIINNTFINCGNLTGDTRWGGNQAIQIQNGKNTQIIECKFYNCSSNTDGAGIRVQGDDNSVNNLTIANCTFDGCIAANSAGALYINKNKDVKDIIIENNTFTNNQAPNYGALDIADAATISSFVNNNFTNNSATAPDGNGGAARLHANINVVNSTFTANSCNGSGGAVYTSGLVNVLGSTFENNTAKSGGAIATNNSNLIVDQSTFKYNKAESGSAISATTVTMSNTELLENQAEFDKWENQNHLISSDHLTVSGTFVGKDNLLNAIKANSGTFNNVTYCGVNGGGVGEGTTNTDDVLSANSYNEVHQIIVMEVYDVNGELKYNVSTYTDEDGNYNFDLSLDGDVVSLVKVYHPEDNYYTGAEYEIVRVPSELSINCENIYVDQEERITFRVTGSKDTPTGNITVLINDTNGNVIFNGTVPLNSSGEANITLSGLNESQYYIYANYTGDYDYLPDAENAAFNVSKWNSTVEVVPVPSIIYGSLENINITVSSSGTTGNFTGNLTVNITSEDAIGFENITKIIELTLDDEGRIIGWTIDDMILPVGNYTIAVAYSGNYKYNGNSSKSRFAVVKAEPAVNVNTTDIDYNTTEPVKVNVTGVDGGEIPTGNVTVVVFNKSGNAVFNDTVPIENGAVTVPVEALTAGDYNVTVTYNGDANYDDAVAKANFTVRAIDSAITVNVTNITYGDDEVIKFNVTDGATGTVNITVTGADGVVATFTDVPIENGTVGVDVAGLAAGNYSVNVTYGGDSNFNPSSAVANFTVSNAKPTVNVNATDIDYNNTEPVKFNVTGVDGGAVPTGNVTVIVVNSTGDVVFNDTVPVEDGVVTVPVLPAGDYDVTVIYNGDGNYTNATGKADFTISAIDSAVTVTTMNITYGDVEVIKFNVTDGATGTVNVTVTGADGVVATFADVPIANGTVGVVVADLPAGNYSVNVTYGGDSNFNPSSAVANFTVSNAKPTVNVTATDIDYNNTEPVKFNVTGVDGGAVPTGNVTVVVTNSSGDVVFNDTVPVEDGVVSVPVLPAGDYDVTVTYNGDGNYTNATGKADFTISAIDSAVTVNLVNITYGDDEVIKFNVTDGATGTVNVTVTGADGVVATFADVPIANGTVGVDVAGLPAGNYSVNVTYGGDNNFNPSSAVANFTVSNAKPTVNVNATDIDYNNTEPVKFNVTGVEGGVTPTGNVTVVVVNSTGDVVFNDTVPVEDGVVTVPVLPAGDYDVTVTYNGDGNYTNTTGKADFTISAIDSAVTVTTMNITYGDIEIIKFNVTDGATGTVNVTVTGADGVVDTYTDVPVEFGADGVNFFDLAAGNYTVNVTYSGDNNFNPSSAVANFTVSKATPTVDIDTWDIDYTWEETVRITVGYVGGGDVPTGNVTVVVVNASGDRVYNDTVRIKPGGAFVTVPANVLYAGVYNVTAIYNGDENYTEATGKANFTVRAIGSAVTVNVTNITYGDDEVIKYNVTKGATGTVNITVTGADGVVATFTDVPIANGTVGVNVADLPAGNYSVNVTYNGDSNFNASSAVANFSVSKASSTVSVNTTDIDYNTTEPVKVNVTGVEGGITPTGNVTVIVTDADGVVVFNDTVPIKDGVVTVPVDDLPAGDYDVNVTYNGDDNYAESSFKDSFTVNSINSTVTADPVNITYGDNETIKFNVTEGATGTVNITVTGADGVVATFADVPIANGTVGVNVAGLAAGNYIVNVTYNGDNNFNPSSDVANFTVSKTTPTVEILTYDINYTLDETILIGIVGVDGGAVPTGNVTVVVTNASGATVFTKTVSSLNAISIVAVPADVLFAGVYNVTATYNGDANYTEATGKANFTVRAIDSAVTVNVTNITYGDNETVKFNVTEGATGTVNITVTGADGVVARFVDVPIENGTVGVNVAGLPAGNYSVNVTYNGDNNFNPSSAVANFTVSNAKPTVGVNATDIDYNNTEPVKFNVTGVDGGAVPTGNVTVVVVNSSGEVVFNDTVPVEDGVVTVPVLPAGDYDVTVTYNGDGNYTNATGKADFTISAIDSAVTVDPVNITYGDDEVIKFNVSEGATGTVNITVTGADGVVATFNDVPIANGTVGVNVADLPAGNYTVNVTYNGDNNFNPSSAVANFTVSKATPAVNVNATDIDYNNTEDIVINVTGVEDGIIPTGNVTVVVTNASGDVVFNETADLSDGKKTVTVPVLPAGDYDVTVTYNGDANYNGAEAKADFTVGMIDSNVTMDLTNITYGENETIKYNVTEGATGTVNITVTDSTGAVVYSEIVPVENGTVGVDVAGLAAGNYTVNVTYSGDNNFNPSSNVANFTVDKVEPTVNVNTTDVDYGNAENILVNVTGVDGGAVPTGNVTVVVTDDGDNVVFNKTVPIENGVATVPVDELPAGDYNVTVTYNGDANYTSATSKDEFTVSKAEPNMKIETTDIDYGQDEDIAIDVTGVDGGAVPTGNVTVVVTDDSGAVVFNKTVPVEDGGVTVPALPAGDYDVKVTYNGDENYTSLTKNDHFSVGKTTPTVLVDAEDIDFHDSEKINVTVNDDATGNVTITVTDENGTVVANDTVKISEGKASIDVVDLPAGKYDVTVEYHGDNNYKRATVEANFTVNAIDPTVIVNASDIDFHDSEKINVTVNDDATGNVTITVTDENGTVVANDTVKISEGKASIDVADLPAGKYDVTVEYPGDNNYKSATSKTNFTVNKIDTPVNMETENITYGEEETITVSVNDDATGDVTISIVSKDGTTVYNETVPIDKASATVTVPNLNAGNYTVQVDYSGDNNYKPNSAEGKFEVAKANATVEIHVYDIIYGDIEELTVSCDAPGNVTIYVNGVNITLPLEEGHGHTLFAALLNAYSGKAQWDLENLAVGTYPASVHYNGNENYNEADDDDVFHVIKKETSVSVSVDDIKVGEDAVINVELSPEAAPGDLTITVDGKEYTVTPKDGKATLKVPGLKAGKHNVTVSYPGSQNYTNSSNSTTFTVSKNSPKMSVSSHDIKVDEDEKITVSVPKDATGTVTITVNGKEYTAPVKDGKAVFNVPGLKAGDYTVKAKYNGDDKYLPEESSDKFTVSKVKPDIKTSAPTVKVGEDGKVTVTLPKDATGKVTIEIDGKKYTAKVKDGKAVFTVSGLKVGKHHIKVYYSGDDKYESAAVDGGDLEVIADNGNGQSEGQAHNGKAIDLSSKATGNPVLALLLVFVILGLIPLRRNKDDEEDEEENP